VAATQETPKGSLRVEELSVRRCRRCGIEWPAYLSACRVCPGALDEPVRRQITVVSPGVKGGALGERVLSVAALAVELSTPTVAGAEPLIEAERVVASLAAAAGRDLLPSGTLVALFDGASFAEAAERGARAAEALPRGGRLEVRSGLALGLVDGGAPPRAAVVTEAEKLARAAQPGQTLATHAVNRELAATWDFAPTGPLPRRREDAVEDAAALLGPKRPAPTPSALASDAGPELIGREAELALLDAELERASAGGTRWCAVVAPAGGGKSKLLRTWLGRIGDQRVQMVGAAASPFGGAPLAVAGALCSALGRPLGSEVSAEEALIRLRQVLEVGEAKGPVLVVVDDLHWADEASQSVLRELARRPLARCLIVVALRRSFVASARWLLERGTVIELPELTPAEREALIRRLLPEDGYAPQRRAVLSAPAAANPLFLEQAAGYAREAEDAETLPATLHAAVCARLDLLLQGRRGGLQRHSAEGLLEVERQIGEWLDRLETEDYESRSAIAEYLARLEAIDLELIVASSLAGRPIERNRRLLAALERFYSASFHERVEAIERLAERNRAGAADAAARGAHRALASLRLVDAEGYLELACRHSEPAQRARHLLTLGDVRLSVGKASAAWHAYRQAAREDEELTRSCAQRLARSALAAGRLRAAEALLETTEGPSNDEAVARCDLAVVRALLGRDSALAALEAAAEKASDPAARRLLLRSRLRVAYALASDPEPETAVDLAGSFVLAADPLAALAEFVETVALLKRALPDRLDSALVPEAERAAARLGNPAALAKVRGREASWQPIHPSV
jgi:hypothetical protein